MAVAGRAYKNGSRAPTEFSLTRSHPPSFQKKPIVSFSARQSRTRFTTATMAFTVAVRLAMAVVVVAVFAGTAKSGEPIPGKSKHFSLDENGDRRFFSLRIRQNRRLYSFDSTQKMHRKRKWGFLNVFLSPLYPIDNNTKLLYNLGRFVSAVCNVISIYRHRCGRRNILVYLDNSW